MIKLSWTNWQYFPRQTHYELVNPYLQKLINDCGFTWTPMPIKDAPILLDSVREDADTAPLKAFGFKFLENV